MKFSIYVTNQNWSITEIGGKTSDYYNALEMVKKILKRGSPCIIESKRGVEKFNKGAIPEIDRVIREHKNGK